MRDRGDPRAARRRADGHPHARDAAVPAGRGTRRSGTVEWLDDKAEQPDDATAEAAHDAYATLVQEATDAEPERDRVDAMDAYAMAATVDFGLEAKQGLLSLRSENARLRLVTRLLRAALKRLDFIERAQARARSNGKVRFG